MSKAKPSVHPKTKMAWLLGPGSFVWLATTATSRSWLETVTSLWDALLISVTLMGYQLAGVSTPNNLTLLGVNECDGIYCDLGATCRPTKQGSIHCAVEPR